MKFLFVSGMMLLVVGILAAKAGVPTAVLKAAVDGNVGVTGALAAAVKVMPEGSVEFVPGIAGKALLLCNTPKQGISLTIKEKFPALSGSLSFWISPLDWKYDDKKFHVFLTANFYMDDILATAVKKTFPIAEFNLYKYANPQPNSGGLGILWRYKNLATKKTGAVISMPEKSADGPPENGIILLWFGIRIAPRKNRR